MNEDPCPLGCEEKEIHKHIDGKIVTVRILKDLYVRFNNEVEILKLFKQIRRDSFSMVEESINRFPEKSPLEVLKDLKEQYKQISNET